LRLGPAGYAIPLQLFSAFAGDPLLIDLYTLRQQGWLSSQDVDSASGLPHDHAEYRRSISSRI
jgi:4-alpha-glucanotransferase